MAQHHHALNLPEVLFRIGRYLESLDDVVACSLVCKSFRASFEPYLWMNIHIGRLHSMEKWGLRHQEPLGRFINIRPRYGDIHQKELGHTARQDKILQGLQRIAPWIRSLVVYAHTFPRQLKFSDRCTGINTLLLAGVPLNVQFGKTYWNDCEALLRQNSACLRSLTLVSWGEGYGYHSQRQPLWRVFSTCAQHINLTTLRIRESTISKQGLDALWRICRQLEILELEDLKTEAIATRFLPSTRTMNQGNNSSSQNGHGLAIEEHVSTLATHTSAKGAFMISSTPNIATTTVRFPKLRELRLVKLDMNSEHQLEQFVVHCPMLQTLVWNTESDQSYWQRFCNYLAAQTWPCLDWIEIKCEKRYVTDQEHALLLQSSPRPLRRLDVDIGTLEQTTFNIYRERGHFATLTKVDLTQSTFPSSLSPPESWIITIPSKQVQEVLESCPMLEHIVAVMITAQDVVKSKPWICHRLRTFEVMINMEFSHSTRGQEEKRTRIKYSEDDKNLCHQIFERLSQLDHLNSLDMRLQDLLVDRILKNKPSSLPLSLRMGLGRLSTLKKLESIGHHGSQEVRVADMEWMLKHWEDLQKIQGTGGRFSVKWSRTNEGVTDERSRLVMEALKARRVQLTPFRTSEELEAFYDCGTDSDSDSDSEGESESEVDN
ncbi:hypothetical protein BGX31_008584, partial [Mortierella sp. GBA43]